MAKLVKYSRNEIHADDISRIINNEKITHTEKTIPGEPMARLVQHRDEGNSVRRDSGPSAGSKWSQAAGKVKAIRQVKRNDHSINKK